jgi:hypothetical protein
MHLVRHLFLDPSVPEPLRVRLLVHHHVGAHGDDDATFEAYFAHAARVADRIGLPIVGTRCSLTEAYRGMKFVHCFSPRNVAASFALDHLFTVFHCASSEMIGRRPKMARFQGISSLDPQLLPLFDTTRTLWMPFGNATTRLEKTAEVLAEDRLRRNLIVCIRRLTQDREGLNCGRCYKCARVLLHAEADGTLDAVSGTFDMEEARRGRTHSLMRLVRRCLGPVQNENEIDLLKYLHEKRFPFPLWMQPAIALALLVHGTKHTLRRSHRDTAASKNESD